MSLTITGKDLVIGALLAIILYLSVCTPALRGPKTETRTELDTITIRDTLRPMPVPNLLTYIRPSPTELRRKLTRQIADSLRRQYARLFDDSACISKVIALQDSLHTYRTYSKSYEDSLIRINNYVVTRGHLDSLQIKYRIKDLPVTMEVVERTVTRERVDFSRGLYGGAAYNTMRGEMFLTGGYQHKRWMLDCGINANRLAKDESSELLIGVRYMLLGNTGK